MNYSNGQELSNSTCVGKARLSAFSIRFCFTNLQCVLDTQFVRHVLATIGRVSAEKA